MHEQIANATFRIECGTSSGSGFSFKERSLVLTNHHVISSHISSRSPIYVITKSGDKIEAGLKSYNEKYDFALLELKAVLPKGRGILKETESNILSIGRKVIYAGFPHGIHDLLVQEAIVSGDYNKLGFYIDASINGGSSGGPIVDFESGLLIGIVTKKRFLGGEMLEELRQPMNQLVSHLETNGSSFMSVGGINFGEFAKTVGIGLRNITNVIESNASTGIGIGFKIKFAIEEYLNPDPKNKYHLPINTSRNAPCGCGSGKKLKHCCGKLT